MGLKERRILWGYAFRNALLPQATGLAISMGHIVGGALVTEVIFAYPGLGWVIFNAIKSLDFPVIQGGVLLIIFSNYLLDVAGELCHRYHLSADRPAYSLSAGGLKDKMQDAR
jgi:peptide/nickel transport system permease protein